MKQGDLGIEVNTYTKVIEQWSQHKYFWSWLYTEEYVMDIQVSTILILYQKKIKGIGVLGVGAPKHKVGALKKIGSKP